MSDGWTPLSDEEHESQIAALLEIVRARGGSARVLDLGAGDGRTASPLAGAGCDVVCVDTDPHAIGALRARGLAAHAWDFLSDDPAPFEGGKFDLIVCLGNTFCLVHDVDDACALLGRLRAWLAPGGVFAIDDIVSDTWRDVASGNWQEGVSEDGDMQLVWAEGENIVALRTGERVDESSWSLTEADAPMRLWTMGELVLLARACGFSRPETVAGGCLIVLTVTGGRS